MKKVIIIGASSGIGKELAKIFASHDYEVGIVARRVDLLNDLASTIPTNTYIRKMDITVTDIQPGFVDTAMAQGDTFWVASPQKDGHLSHGY